VQLQAAGFERARADELPGLDLQHVVTAVAVFIEPLADRIACERRRLIGREAASVGIDPAHRIALRHDICRMRPDHDFTGLGEVHHLRLAGMDTGQAEAVALSAIGLLLHALLEDGLVFRRERRLQSKAHGLGRIPRIAEPVRQWVPPLGFHIGIGDFAALCHGDGHQHSHCHYIQIARRLARLSAARSRKCQGLAPAALAAGLPGRRPARQLDHLRHRRGRPGEHVQEGIEASRTHADERVFHQHFLRRPHRCLPHRSVRERPRSPAAWSMIEMSAAGRRIESTRLLMVDRIGENPTEQAGRSGGGSHHRTA
jgi:hypothetical protein